MISVVAPPRHPGRTRVTPQLQLVTGHSLLHPAGHVHQIAGALFGLAQLAADWMVVCLILIAATSESMPLVCWWVLAAICIAAWANSSRVVARSRMASPAWLPIPYQFRALAAFFRNHHGGVRRLLNFVQDFADPGGSLPRLLGALGGLPSPRPQSPCLLRPPAPPRCWH